MAQPNNTPRLARTEEYREGFFCLIDDAYALLDPRARCYESLEDVMNFGSGTAAFGHGYSKSVLKRCLRRRVDVRGPVSRAPPRRPPTTRVRSARGP
jgi:hypothetical protein